MTGTENENATPSDKFATEADDTFNVLGGVDSFRIDGVGGNNVLNIRADDDVTPILVQNVQVVNIQSRDAGGADIDGSRFEGVTQWWSDASRQNLTVEDVEELAAVGLKGGHADVTYTVLFDDQVTEDNDELTVVLSSVGVRAGANDGATLKVDGFETFNVVSSGISTLAAIDADELVELNISGSGTLSLATDSGEEIESVDATAFAGDSISVDVSGGAGAAADASLLLGDSDATLTVAQVLLAAGDEDLVIDLGEGDNTLAVTSVSGAGITALNFDAGDISGVGTLRLDNDGNNITLGAGRTLDLEGIAPSTIVFDEDDDLVLATHTLTFDNEQAALSVVFEGVVTGGVSAELEFSNNVTALALINEDTFGTGGNVDVTGNRITELTLDADDDAFYGVITTANNTTKSATNVLTVNTDGDGDISGTLAVDTHLNGIVLNNEGEGDREFALNDEGALKATAGANQAAGQGVVVAGDGEGEVVVAGTAAILNNLSIDGTGYADTTVAQIETTNGAVNASKFSDVDVIRVAVNMNAQSITRIQEDVLVDFTIAQTGTVTLQNAVAGAMDVQFTGGVGAVNLAVKNATELTVTSAGAGATVVSDLQSTMVLPDSVAQLETINLVANTGANLTVSDISLETATGDNTTLTVNLDGKGSGVVTVGDISANAGGAAEAFTEITINSTGGTGPNVVSALSAVTDGAFETLTITGDQSLTFTSVVLGQNDQEITFDASEFTGELLTLTLAYANGVGSSGDDNEHVIQLGSGDADITLTDPGAGPGATPAGRLVASNDYFVFEFVGDDIGEVTISNFLITASLGATTTNNDVLDLSELGIEGLDDLVFDNATNSITAADGQFEGTIVLTGVNTEDMVAADFVFA